MGSVSAAALIISFTFFVAFTMIYSTSLDTQHDILVASEYRDKINKNYYDSSIKIINVTHNGKFLNISIINDGKTVLNPHYLTVLVNGNYDSAKSISVNGKDTTIWNPEEIVNLTLYYNNPVERIKVITEFGNYAYYMG